MYGLTVTREVPLPRVPVRSERLASGQRRIEEIVRARRRLPAAALFQRVGEERVPALVDVNHLPESARGLGLGTNRHGHERLCPRAPKASGTVKPTRPSLPVCISAHVNALNQEALNQLFLDARSFGAWEDRPVPDETLERLYALVRMGPTAVNASPLRLVFVKSGDAKAKLKPALNAGNVDKTMQAPVTAIVAYDTSFHEYAPKLFPGRDLKSKFEADPVEVREKLAAYNAALQTGYLVAAARALGLDVGPRGGFDKAKVDDAFLAGTSWRSALLVNLGYGDRSKLHPRLPRLDFEQAARIE